VGHPEKAGQTGLGPKAVRSMREMKTGFWGREGREKISPRGELPTEKGRKTTTGKHVRPELQKIRKKVTPVARAVKGKS